MQRVDVMCERVSVAEASKVLGVSPQCLRLQMQKGIINIGYVAKDMSRGESYRYYIFRDKLDRLVGKDKE